MKKLFTILALFALTATFAQQKTITIDDVKNTIGFDGNMKTSLVGLCDVWYKQALQSGMSPSDAALNALVKLGDKLLELGAWISCLDSTTQKQPHFVDPMLLNGSVGHKIWLGDDRAPKLYRYNIAPNNYFYSEFYHKIDSLQAIIDSITNNKCGIITEELDGYLAATVTKWRDTDLFTIGTSGDLRVRVLGQEICDPDGVLADYIEFGHKFKNMQFLTLNPKTGEQDYADYDEIKKNGLLVRHYEYEECCYPFHRDSWIHASEIDNYCGYFWPGGPYVLIGSK